jgi:thioredoxin-like negative regulator of GroEL
VKGIWFIQFYTPLSNESKNLALTWDKFADKNKGIFSVGKVNCEDPKSISLCTQFGIENWPTLILFKNDSYYLYTGQKDIRALETFVNV